MEPLISIIVPVFNVENYIKRCLLSIASQSYKGPIECIIVDDCGYDNSIKICTDFITNYKGDIHFSIIHHQQNKGLAAARNTGTLHSKGEYIYYIDSDDEITSNCITLLVEALKNHPNAEIIQGNIEALKDSYNISHHITIDYIEDNNPWVRKQFYNIRNIFPVNAWNKLIKREFIFQNRLFFMEGIIHEDQQWMFHVTKVLQSIAFVFEPTYIHYITTNSIMSSLSQEKSDESWLRILEDIYTNFDEPFYKEQLIKYTIELICHYNKKLPDYKDLYQSYLLLLKKNRFYANYLCTILSFQLLALTKKYKKRYRIVSIINLLFLLVNRFEKTE